jgi:hypothetical protein
VPNDTQSRSSAERGRSAVIEHNKLVHNNNEAPRVPAWGAIRSQSLPLRQREKCYEFKTCGCIDRLRYSVHPRNPRDLGLPNEATVAHAGERRSHSRQPYPFSFCRKRSWRSDLCCRNHLACHWTEAERRARGHQRQSMKQSLNCRTIGSTGIVGRAVW